MRPAHRLDHTEEYYFSKKLREVSKLRKQGKSVLNLAIGNPDLPPHPSVIKELTANALADDVHGYQSYQGIPELRNAISDYMQKTYRVEVDASDEILPLLGSKEGIMHISMAYLNAGDKILVPDLGYPTYSAVGRLLEAEVISYPLDEQNNWEPDWSFFEGFDFTGVKILWLNYPHMPTGSRGSEKVFTRLIALATAHDFLLVHDNPYSHILNDDPASIFSYQGAREVALELNSLSKTFNMAGWRVGWVSGEAEKINPVLKVKSNMDSGMFRPIQLAAIKALELGEAWYTDLNEVYTARQQIALQLLELLGCEVRSAQSGLFLWGKSKTNTTELVDNLLYQKGIFLCPGHVFGEKGRHYLRISLCNPEADYAEAISRMQS